MSQARLWLFEHQTVQLERRGARWCARPEHGGALLTAADLDALESEAERLGDGDKAPPLTISRRGRIRAAGRVGVFQAGRLTVELLPKVDRESPDPDPSRARLNLIEMLTLSGALPPVAKPGTQQRVERMDLYETVIGVFSVSLLEALREGPRRAYVPTVQNLGVLKGRLVFPEHLRRNLARPDRAVCAYHHLTLDQPANRVLRYATWLARRATAHPANRWRLDRCAAILGDVTLATQTVADCDALVLDRFMERFAEALGWARLLIASHSPALCHGERPTFSLLFDMADVFEDYVARVARTMLGHRFRKVEEEPTIGHLIHQPGQKPKVAQVPDLVLHPFVGRPIILDTKYKVFPGSIRAAEADLRQVYVYQRLLQAHLAGREAGRTVLLYPRSHGASPSEPHQAWLVDPPGATGGVHVTVASVGIDAEGRALRTQLAAELEALLCPSETLRKGA